MMMFLIRLSLLSLMVILSPAAQYAWAVETPFVEEDDSFKKITRSVPIMTFRQQVDSVVTIQRHPNVLQATVDQEGDMIAGSLVISNDRNRKQAKELAKEFIRIIKKKSLDEEPNAKEIGKGLYTYKIEVSRANKTVLATGIKRFDDVDIKWAINDDGVKDEAILSDEMPQ